MMRSFRPPPAAPAPWPRLMLMSCAASGVAENRSAATEAATVVRRTRRPQRMCISECASVALFRFVAFERLVSVLCAGPAEQACHFLFEAIVQRLAGIRLLGIGACRLGVDGAIGAGGGRGRWWRRSGSR